MSGPTDVAPVTVNGLRIDALHWGKDRGLGQNGGYVTATDPASDTELWAQKVYDITYGDKSPQKYDLFITKLTVVDDGAAVQITDQDGRVFHLDPATRAVRMIMAPVPDAPKPNPRKPS